MTVTASDIWESVHLIAEKAKEDYIKSLTKEELVTLISAFAVDLYATNRGMFWVLTAAEKYLKGET